MTNRKQRTWKRVPAALAVLLASLALGALADETQPAADEEGAQQLKNGLRWSTASEVDNFGYHVYRGESEEGPFERLTADPILGAGTTDERSTYEFVDDTIEPDTTYWYYIESISKDGEKQRFTPIFRKDPASAKTSPEPEADADEAREDPKT